MKCDRYRDALLDTAAGHVKGRILAHVEECSQCRATLKQEQALFVAIDHTLRAHMAEAPRDGFLADVRARISQESEPKLSLMNPVWTLATASVMVAMLVMVTPWTKKLRREPIAVSGPTLSTTHASPEMKDAAPHAGNQRRGKRQSVPSTAAREPEVLVPSDEREALARFITRLRERDEVAVAFASPAAEEKDKPMEIPPLEISRLQLKALMWEKWKPAEDHHDEEDR